MGATVVEGTDMVAAIGMVVAAAAVGDMGQAVVIARAPRVDMKSVVDTTMTGGNAAATIGTRSVKGAAATNAGAKTVEIGKGGTGDG